MMNDNDLEALLRDHYRAIDPTVAPRDLDLRIEDALDRRISRQAPFARLPVLAAALAAVVVVAAIIGLWPGGPLMPAGASPRPTSDNSSASPSAQASGSASTATPGLPSGSVPPVSTQAWTTLDLQPLQVGPPAGSWVVGWSGGYLALWQSGAPHYHLNDDYFVGAGPLYAWVSGDGRVWTPLPADTYGSVVDTFGAAPLGDGVVVITRVNTKSEFSTTAWLSKDGTTWTSSPAPGMTLTGGLYPWPPSQVEDNEVAGGPGGVVALSGNGIAFSPDGQVWQNVTLPGDGFEVAGVEAFGTGFVAVGISDSSTTSNPVAWWSADGVHWSATTVTRPGEGFIHVHAAYGGLVAEGWGGPLSDLHSLWTSPDGRSWSLGAEPALPGHGDSPSAGGWIEGDGTRLLWYSVPGDAPTAYFTSLDGISWTQLRLTGDASAASAGQETPFLMRDGILFTGTSGKWFGSAAK
jgi:hypothetical protein